MSETELVELQKKTEDSNFVEDFKELGDRMEKKSKSKEVVLSSSTFTKEEEMLIETVFKIARQFVAANLPIGEDEQSLMAMIALKNKIKTL